MYDPMYTIVAASLVLFVFYFHENNNQMLLIDVLGNFMVPRNVAVIGEL